MAFVYASWFARELASRIAVACPDASGWDARHVEMALFMLGKPSRSERNFPPSTIDAILESIDERLAELSDQQSLLEAARHALGD